MLTISTAIHGTILLMHVGISKMSCKIRSTKGYLSSLEKKKTMAIDVDPFPLVALVNTTSFYLRSLIEYKKAGKLFLRKLWVLKYCMVSVDRLKKERVLICTDHPSARNSVKGI